MGYVLIIQVWMFANCISNTAFTMTNDHTRCCQAGIKCRHEPLSSLRALQIGQPFMLQELSRMPRPPSQGGPPLLEPASPYLNPSQPRTTPSSTAGPFGVSSGPAPFGMAVEAAPASANALQQPFGTPNLAPAQSQPSPSGRIQFGQKAGQSASNPFGSSIQGQSTSFQPAPAPSNLFGQGSQSGRLQFGARAGQPAAAQVGSAISSQGAAAPFGTQSKPVKPFDSTDDPFGRQKPSQPGQGQQPAAQASATHPFAQQLQQQQPSAMSDLNSNPFAQQPPATPAAFGAFGGPQAGQSQPSTGLDFQTPAVQQRPAFGGGVAASLQSPSPGRQHPAALSCCSLSGTHCSSSTALWLSCQLPVVACIFCCMPRWGHM